jgi:hypothetical protein
MAMVGGDRRKRVMDDQPRQHEWLVVKATAGHHHLEE